ncbi:MAG: hypothetical protein QN162_12935 [Armatimonadota bacterium]|nr:hypothetical protein [Armatimonadota bacterium]
MVSLGPRMHGQRHSVQRLRELEVAPAGVGGPHPVEVLPQRLREIVHQVVGQVGPRDEHRHHRHRGHRRRYAPVGTRRDDLTSVERPPGAQRLEGIVADRHDNDIAGRSDVGHRRRRNPGRQKDGIHDPVPQLVDARCERHEVHAQFTVEDVVHPEDLPGVGLGPAAGRAHDHAPTPQVLHAGDALAPQAHDLDRLGVEHGDAAERGDRLRPVGAGFREHLAAGVRVVGDVVLHERQVGVAARQELNVGHRRPAALRSDTDARDARVPDLGHRAPEREVDACCPSGDQREQAHLGGGRCC